MDDAPVTAEVRPLTRSLEPLTGESLEGFLLRLSYRLRISPMRLSHLAGCTTSTTHLSRKLLLDLDIDRFARATLLTQDEAVALTLTPWADRYPPIARSKPKNAVRPTWNDDWLFSDIPRYCPRCLAGDGSPIQQQYGGPWKKLWQLPIAFSCPEHHTFLEYRCPRGHPPKREIWRLLTRVTDGTLHPAQCRLLRHEAGLGKRPPSCGIRLDQTAENYTARPTAKVLETQRQLFELLGPGRPAEDASCYFADLRMVTSLLCASWPAGRDLVSPGLISASDEHVRLLNTGPQPLLDTPPKDPAATGALLTAAATVLTGTDLEGSLAQYFQAAWAGNPSRSPWGRVFARHKSTCSEILQQAAEPANFGIRRRNGLRYAKAPVTGVSGYRPENIPAFLEESWFQQHLVQCRPNCVKAMRRTAAVQLVQWKAGGSMGKAAQFLGLHTTKGKYRPSDKFYEWLREYGRDRFTASLRDLARDLDAASHLTDYHQRREALQAWFLPLDTWRQMISDLPIFATPTPPELHDYERQEASVFIWARVTQGDPRSAPRPIEAAQPEQTSHARHPRRSSARDQLTRPDPPHHYAALRDLLVQEADRLAQKIDNSNETDRFQQARPGSN